jgi:DNA gyrase/topoisomerase IV subunit A
MAILASSERLLQVIREELIAVRDQFGDPRRTEIQASHLDLSIEDLIAEEDMVVTVSRTGYAKTQPLSDYQAQRRGGRGKSATTVKDEDVIEHLLVANDPRHRAAVHQQPGQGLLAQGLRDAQCQPRLPRQAAGQPAAAGGGRGDQRHFAGARLPGGQLYLLRHRQRHRQEAPASTSSRGRAASA